jgi:hypothetical protein
VSIYRATVRVEGGTLHTARPLTAPDEVRALVDSVVFAMTEHGGLASVALEFETSTDSDTPVGDSIAATSSQPVGTHHDDDGGGGNPFDDQPLPTSAVPAVQP